MLMMAITIIATIGANAQSWDYTETFENHNATAGGYTNNSFLGDNGVTWTFVQGRADNGYRVNPNDNSFMLATFSANNPRITSSVITGGIKNFRVYLRKAFTSNSNRQVALYINGNFITNSVVWNNTDLQVLEVNDLDIPGDVVIEIRNLGAQVSIDDLSWTKFGGGNGGIPSKVKITNLKPAVPMANIPFRTLVELIDDNNFNQTIPSPTRIIFKILDNTANLLYQEETFIPANSAVFFINNINLNYSGEIIIQAEAPDNKNLAGYYLEDASESFMMTSTPVLDIDIYSKGHAGAIHPVIVVKALDAQGNVNPNYHSYSGNLIINNGGFTGNVNATFNNGIATFSDIVFTNPNVTYSVSAQGQYLATSISENVVILPMPTMSEVIVPAYLKGEGSFLPDGNGRMPSYALVTFNNLHPETEYRFITGGVETVPNNITTTAGNNLCYNHNTGNYVMTSTKNLNEVGNYSSFVTGNGQTSKTIWVNMIPTTNTVFAVNKEIFWAVDLGNETGAVVSRLYSSKKSRNLRFSTSANNFTTGLVSYASGLYDSYSPSSPKNYIVVYDQNNNPITTAIVQSSGANLATPGFPHQAPSYYENTEFTDGAWATFIPNNLPGGVRKISEYTPEGNIVNEWTDNDGIWADYNTMTSNYGAYPPSENSVEVAFAIPQFELISPNTGTEICNPVDEAVAIFWESRGVGLVNIYVSQNMGSWEPLAFDYDARELEYLWNIIRDRYSFTDNRIRIQSVEFPYIDVVSGTFNVFDTPVINNFSQSNVWCPDEDIYITVEAIGTGLTYQWYKDGIRLNDNDDYNGVNTEILYINNLQHRLTGTYHAVVKGHTSCDDVQTGPIAIYVARPLSIFKPTEDVNIGAKLGDRATLEFTVHGNGGNGLQDDIEKYQYKIQWYKYDPNLPVDVPLNDGMPRVAGSKSNYLTINKFRKQDEGKYYAVIKGLCGEAVRTPFFEITEIELSITTQPTDLESCIGTNAQFTFDYFTNINETPEIRWFKNGIELNDGAKYTGTRTKTLTVNNVEDVDAGSFTAQVHLVESGTNVNTALGLLRVLKPAVITLQSEGQIEFEEGNQMLLEVIAEGNDDLDVLTYQWFKDGTPITDANESMYIKDNITSDDAGVYTCEITSICGTITSNPVTVVITTGGIVSNVTEVSNLGYSLSGATPNPVNSEFSINVELPESAFAELVLSDMTGKTIATIHSGILEEGIHNLVVDITKLNLTSGTYFYSLRSSKVSLTQSFIVVK
jgi:hypothetical protein